LNLGWSVTGLCLLGRHKVAPVLVHVVRAAAAVAGARLAATVGEAALVRGVDVLLAEPERQVVDRDALVGLVVQLADAGDAGRVTGQVAVGLRAGERLGLVRLHRNRPLRAAVATRSREARRASGR